MLSDGLDGVSWIVMTPDSDDQSAGSSLGLSLVPEGRPATMVASNLLTALTSRRAVRGSQPTLSAAPKPVRAQGTDSRAVESSVEWSDKRVDRTGIIERLLTPVDLRPDVRFTNPGLLSESLLEELAGETTPAVTRLNGVFRRGYVDFEEFRQIVQAEDTPGAEPTEELLARAGVQRSKSNITAASKLRHNLRRPIVTARERMAVSTHMGRALEKLASHTPQLARALANPSMLATGGPASWIASPAVIQEMVRLAPAQKRKLATSFMEAGWSRSDLNLLNLDSGGGPKDDRGLESAMPLSTPQTQMGREFKMGHEGMPTRRSRPSLTSEKIVRNLARILTGTEGLVASMKAGTDRPQQTATGGKRLNRAAVASLSSFLPLLRTKPSTYFGSLAPEQRVGYTRLSDALTELVAIAENELQQSDGTVSAEVQTSLRSQLGRVGQAVGLASRPRSVDTAMVAEQPGLMPKLGKQFEEMATTSMSAPSERRITVGYGNVAGTDMAMVQTPPLENRINDALSGVQRGPAGVERLLRVRQETPSSPVAGLTPQEQPALAELGRRSSPDLENGVGLTSVLAPEIMLHGVTGIRTADTRGYRETPGVLASLGPDDRTQGQGGHRRDLSGAKAVQRRTLSRLLQNVKGTGGKLHRGNGLTPRIIGRLLNRLDERQSVSAMSRLDVGEFALSWLRRVDGQLSGIDAGLEGSSAELASFFGLADTRTSSLAADSPVTDAKLVSPGIDKASVSGDDPSGLRNLGAAMGQGGRSSRQVSEASSKVDWGFVNTGSGSSTSHVDMEALAASAFGSGNTTKGSMPLVAPAVKAVAQTAMRSSKSEEAPAATPSVQQAPSDEEAAPASAGGMDDKAMDQLAQEMAGRISRRLKREKDRRGIWA